MALSVRAATRASAAAAGRRWRTERLFFTGMSVAMVAAVFWGFSRSYYLKELYSSPVLSPLFHVHGLLFTAWMLLLIVQTRLIASRRVATHRSLGVAGGVLAVLMTIAAALMTLDLARRTAPLPTTDGLAFVIIPFSTIIVFPVLVGAALFYRGRADIHKRLMLIATLELVTAGVARIPGVGGLPMFFLYTDLGLLAMVVYDLVSLGRPHAATVWAGLFMIASQVVRTSAGGTETWINFARMLAG